MKTAKKPVLPDKTQVEGAKSAPKQQVDGISQIKKLGAAESSDDEKEEAKQDEAGFNQAREEEKKRNRERLEEIKRKRELAAKEKEEQNSKLEDQKKK